MKKAFSREPGSVDSVIGNLFSTEEDGSLVIVRHITHRRPLPGQDLQPPKGGIHQTIGRLQVDVMKSQPILVNADGDSAEEEAADSRSVIASGFSVVLLPKEKK